MLVWKIKVLRLSFSYPLIFASVIFEIIESHRKSTVPFHLFTFNSFVQSWRSFVIKLSFNFRKRIAVYMFYSESTIIFSYILVTTPEQRAPILSQQLPCKYSCACIYSSSCIIVLYFYSLKINSPSK